MFDVVKNGAEEDGMPAYGEVLSDKQVYELVDYILAAIEDKKSEEFNTGKNEDVVFVSEGMRLKLELVAENADSPWAITQSNDGRLFYTDKSGKLFSKKDSVIQEITGLPTVKNRGQGGMMDVILHPNFVNNQRIYLSYSKPKSDNPGYATTAVFSGVIEDNAIKNGKDIFVAAPYLKTHVHYGCRMIFDKYGFLFVAVGERGRRDDNPQNLDNDLGKILGFNDDGTVPADNPFYNTPNARISIYSYGHRNPQGLCYNPVTDKLYNNEHGPIGGDEVNLVEAGRNYGWPVITYGINYIGTKITDLTHHEATDSLLGSIYCCLWNGNRNE
jgi:glucose/arabinose dehydrogenase